MMLPRMWRDHDGTRCVSIANKLIRIFCQFSGNVDRSIPGEKMRSSLILVIGLSISGLSDDVRADRDACGLNNLTLVLAYLSGDPDQPGLAQLLPLKRAPFSLAELELAAHSLGYDTELARWRRPKQASFRCPAILHIRRSESSTAPDHFLACFGESADGICVAEFPRPPLILSRRRLERVWDGDLLYVDRPGRTAITELRRGAFLDTACLVLSVSSVLLLSSMLIYEAWHGRKIVRSPQIRT